MKVGRGAWAAERTPRVNMATARAVTRACNAMGARLSVCGRPKELAKSSRLVDLGDPSTSQI